MPPQIFKQADTVHLIDALAQDTTHDGISTFEMSLGIDTNDGGSSKAKRASLVVQHMFESPDSDNQIINMLDYLYVAHDPSRWGDGKTYERLKSRVLAPRGIKRTDDGFVFSNVATSTRVGADSLIPSSGTKSLTTPHSVEPFPVVAPNAVELHSPDHSVARDATAVFVVHGRDMRPVDALAQFLLFLGLRMMSWPDAVALTRKPQPHTLDVVAAGMEHSAAIVVIFSPDDLAHIRDEFSEPNDPDSVPTGQARQNVTLEAGMAFALAPERTIFLKSAQTRDISDIDGFNWVKMDGTWNSRSDLRNRLTVAGAAIREANSNLNDPLAGPFEVTG